MILLMQVNISKIVQRGSDSPFIRQLAPECQTLFVVPGGFFVSSKLTSEVSTTVEGQRALRDKLSDGLRRNRIQHKFQSFFPVAAYQPETPECQRQSEP